MIFSAISSVIPLTSNDEETEGEASKIPEIPIYGISQENAVRKSAQYIAYLDYIQSKVQHHYCEGPNEIDKNAKPNNRDVLSRL